MALPTDLNDLAKLTLLASDAAYFKTDLVGSWLAALPDTQRPLAAAVEDADQSGGCSSCLRR